MKVSDKTPRRGQRVRFSGLVTPAHDGTAVKLQRRTRTGWKTRQTLVLAAATPLNGVARSTYSTRLRVRSTGRYRAVVVPTDGDHLRGKSPRKRLGSADPVDAAAIRAPSGGGARYSTAAG